MWRAVKYQGRGSLLQQRKVQWHSTWLGCQLGWLKRQEIQPKLPHRQLPTQG